MTTSELKVMLVDDEPLARARLKSLLKELGAGTVVAEAGEGHEAVLLAQEHAVQVVLMDIRMPGMDGLEAARHLGYLATPPAIIFTTAYDAHALAAFEANAVDYLLKPIRRERLQVALDKAGLLSQAQLQEVQSLAHGAVRSHVSATLQGDLQLLPVAQVRYFCADHKYVTARHAHGELVLDESLASLESEFSEQFIRIHRNALAARAHIRGLEKTASGGHLLVFDGIDDRLEISRRLLATVRRFIR